MLLTELVVNPQLYTTFSGKVHSVFTVWSRVYRVITLNVIHCVFRVNTLQEFPIFLCFPIHSNLRFGNLECGVLQCFWTCAWCQLCETAL